MPRLPRIALPRMSDHGSEIVLFGIIALGVLWTINSAIDKGQLDKLDVAACLLVLSAIVSAVKERWTQRSVDRMGDQLGQSLPQTDAPNGTPGNPISVAGAAPGAPPVKTEEASE